MVVMVVMVVELYISQPILLQYLVVLLVPERSVLLLLVMPVEVEVVLEDQLKSLEIP